ncbi:MAG: acetamidase/formamidase family protein, partial [Candidatus Acidiferrales bacterium]
MGVAKRFGVMLLAAVALILAARAVAQTASNTAPAHVVRYHATNDNVKYDYCVAPAVAHVHSGDIIEANTLDCFGNAIQHPGDTLAMAKGDNPLTGPFYIDGAEPGDTLAIRFLSLEVNGKQGIGALAPGF